MAKKTTTIAIVALFVCSLLVSAAQAVPVAPGTDIGIDFGVPSDGNVGNFNEITTAGGGLTAGNVTNTLGQTLDGISIITNIPGSGFANSDPGIGPADPAALALGFQEEHLDDFVGATGSFIDVFVRDLPDFPYLVTVVTAFDNANLGVTVRVNNDPATDVLIDTTSATPFVTFAVSPSDAIFPNTIQVAVFGAATTNIVNAILLQAVPEPSTGLLLGFGLFGLIMRRRNRC